MTRLLPRYRTALASLAFTGLVGCAGPTGYQQAARSTLIPAVEGSFDPFAYGYRVRDLSAGDYSIVVRTNEATPVQRAADIALLRAAYLAQERGKTRFAVLHSRSLTLPRAITTMVPVPTGYGLAVFPIGTVVNDKVAVLGVHLHGPDPAPAASLLEAQAVIDRLGPGLAQ